MIRSSIIRYLVVAAIALAAAGATAVPAGATAHWFVWNCGSAFCSRTTPDNAVYTANECGESGANSLACFGQYIWGDGPGFEYYCGGTSPATIGSRLRYWADRARENGPDWRVYTQTENGGYPMWCYFSVIQLP